MNATLSRSLESRKTTIIFAIMTDVKTKSTFVLATRGQADISEFGSCEDKSESVPI